MKRKLLLLIWPFFIFPTLTVWGQGFYWVSFTDKDESPWSLSNPAEFLSERAIQRRERQGISIDSLDLPVNPGYIRQVLDLGSRLVHSSKWLNGVTVEALNDQFEDRVHSLFFVKSAELTKPAVVRKSLINKFFEPDSRRKYLDIDTTTYGASVHQVGQLNGHFLHNQGFRGEGMQIAVLDAGFYHADRYMAFDSLWAGGRILGTRDFVDPGGNVYEDHYHGMSVLSIMGGNIPGELIGTAPAASYWLIRSEDIYSEYLIEEDNWVAAAEYADSVGVDIINSSLGYFLFDDPEMNHTYGEMDGKTTRVTRAANIAASRGILVFSSAGNEGDKTNGWKYIIAPSDGDSVIGVGAVNYAGDPAPFTSYGPASDGDVKPNVVATGWHTIVQNRNGDVVPGNGTSYSSPVLAGISACLWQANPHATARQVKQAIEKSANLFNNPDSLLGYGIPDMVIADQLLKTPVFEQWQNGHNWLVYPNPVIDYVVLQNKTQSVSSPVQIAFFSPDGRLVRKNIEPGASRIMISDLQDLPAGLWIMQIISEGNAEAVKIYKSP